MLPSLLLALAQSVAPGDVDWITPFLRAARSLEGGDVRAALADLASSSRILPGHPQTEWLAACAHARLGEHDAAFAELRACVEHGGGDWALLAWEPDLASLRADARYTELLAALRARAVPDRSSWEGELVTRVGGFAVSLGPHAESIGVGRGPHALLLDGVSGEVVTALERPGERSSDVAISPDGRIVVVAGSRDADRVEFLRVHDARSGAPIRELEPLGWQSNLQFSADSRRLFVGAFQKTGAVWNTDDWTRAKPIAVVSEQAVISPSGNRLLLLSREGESTSDVVLWDVDVGAAVVRCDGAAVIPNTSFGFSADGAIAFFLENRGSCLRTLDGRDGKDLACIRPTAEPGVADSAPGRVRFASATYLGASDEIATIDARRVVRIWDARTGLPRREFVAGEGDDWRMLDAALDGRTIYACAFPRDIRAFDAQVGTPLWSEPETFAGTLAFSPEGSRVGYTGWEMPPTIRDARTGAIERRHTALALPGPSVVADRGEGVLWIGAGDGSLRRIDAATGRTTRSSRPGLARIVEMVISADSARLATLDAAGVTRVVRTDTGVVEGTVAGKRTPDDGWGLSGLVFAPGGDALLVTSPAEGLRILAAPDWTPRCTLRVEKPRWSRTFTRDGSRVLVAGQGGQLHVLDARTGEPARPPISIDGEVDAIGLEPNGRVWIGSDRSTVRVVDLETGATVREIGLQDLDSFDTVEVGSITFRADGQLAVVASSGFGVVAGYDPANGRRLWNYEYDGGNPGALQSAFDASGERVYVWGQGQWSSRVVDAKSGKTIVDLRGRYDELLPLVEAERFAATCPAGIEGVGARNGRVLWTRTETADDGWVLTTPSRHCDGTPDSLTRVHLALSDGSWPLDALAASLLDPKRVRAAADGIELAPARLLPIPTLVQTQPRPRVVTLAADRDTGTCEFEAECADGVSGFEVVVDGRARFEPGQHADATHRRLALDVSVAVGGRTSVRCRAIATSGMRSRAAHATFERR